MSMLPTLVINNVEVPIHAIHDFSQNYEKFGGFGVLRRLDGSGLGQHNWDLLRTRISGSGSIPPGFAGLAPATAYTVACGAPRRVQSVSATGIQLPAARRSDGVHAPVAYAWVPGTDPSQLSDGLVKTPILSIVADVADVQVVTGAQSYMVVYYPLITAFLEITESADIRKAVYSWEIVAEEQG